ncbi:MAG: chromate transporter, partial [Pseudomonadota bacterium]
DVYVLGAHLQVPDTATTNVPSLVIAGVAMLALFRFKIGMIWVIAGCAGLGAAYQAARTLLG